MAKNPRITTAGARVDRSLVERLDATVRYRFPHLTRSKLIERFLLEGMDRYPLSDRELTESGLVTTDQRISTDDVETGGSNVVEFPKSCWSDFSHPSSGASFGPRLSAAFVAA